MITIITIDGPAGVGKSTIARNLAKELGIAYLDTGAMYRTLGLSLGPQAENMSDDELRRRCREFVFSLERAGLDGDYALFCNGHLVGDEIRSEQAGRLASLVARLPVLREVMREAQRAIAARQSLVAEGRDMGTIVFPQAGHKIFLDARPEVRAERRHLELAAKSEISDAGAILADITDRDKRDRERQTDPLRPAPDAVSIDTSDLNLAQVMARVSAAVRGPAFSHLDEQGNMRMVNVGEKNETARVARATATVEMSSSTLKLMRDKALPKGDVFAAAKLAGIMAAKRTWELIPLCHPLNITKADVRFTVITLPPSVVIETEVHTIGRTGVEMEAIIAAQVAAATIYDMAKAVQKDMIIGQIRLLYKAGGKSGEFFGGGTGLPLAPHGDGVL